MKNPGPKRELLVRHNVTKKIVHRVDVTEMSESRIIKCTAGLLRNMSEDYHVDDSDPTSSLVTTRGRELDAGERAVLGAPEGSRWK